MSNGVTNLGGFKDFIDDAVGQIEEDATQIMLKIGMDLWRKIVLKTPVDTGRAQNSWNMQWNSPNPYTPPPGEYDDPSMPNPGEPIIGGTLHISSNLNYIKFLEQGSPGPGSEDAPSGMVQVSLEELTNQL